MRRALVICVLATLAVPAAAHGLIIGIGDQKAEMFSDPRFLGLGIRDARVVVAWDAMESDWQRSELDTWLAAARVAGVRPLVSFDHSRLPGRRRQLPTPERFKYEFRQFRARYPWVTAYATWNEANLCGEPTCHRPQLVAAYYRALRKECPICRIVAAELLDMPNMASWVKTFLARAHVQPRYWGLHNYLDANRFRTSGTEALLRLTKGQIWFTETGGIVDRRNRSHVSFEQSPRHAAAAVRWVFDRLAPLSGRITRVYLYHWRPKSSTDTWDSALIGLDGKVRPAYRVLQRALADAARR